MLIALKAVKQIGGRGLGEPTMHACVSILFRAKTDLFFRDLETAWEAVRLAKRPRVHTFLATSAIHMEYKLKMTPDQASHLYAQAAPVHNITFISDMQPAN